MIVQSQKAQQAKNTQALTGWRAMAMKYKHKGNEKIEIRAS